MVVPHLLVKVGGLGGSNIILSLHVKNEGEISITIIKVEIDAGKGSYINYTSIKVPAGTTLDVTIDKWVWEGLGDPIALTPGGKYRVKVYTEKFGVFYQDVVASG